MNRRSNHRSAIALFLFAVAFAPGLAASELQPAALTHADTLVRSSALPVITAPPVDLDLVRAEDAQRDQQGLAPRFAIANSVLHKTDTDGLWELLDDGTQVWRLKVSSPGARSLNLGFGEFFMPDGGRLNLYSSDLEQIVRPFTSGDNASHGELWTPIVESDEIVIEVTLPAGTRDELKLELTSVNVGYRGFDEVTQPLSGSCNIDVVCPDGDAWRDEIPAVAAISTGGSLFCSGFMVNNTAADQTPYFMTAYHCNINSSNAASLVAYWNYETSSCGGSRDGTLSDFQSGSFFRSRYSPSDFVLVELDQAPDPAWEVTFAGWDRTPADASSAVAIHHPSVDEKAISFENDPTTTTSYLNNAVPGDGTHIRVTDWDAGTTEGGSSGSPLFNQDHRVIGQLHGGYASCSSQTSDWYGRFSVSWNGGGSPATRLSDWLDPGNSGATTVDTLVVGGCINDGECDDGLFCNGSESCSGGSCTAGGDPCSGQGCDEADDLCVPCDGDGLCENGEDCIGCASDCVSGGGGGCGNGVCEPSLGEDCLSCATDCRGKQSGNPNRRYCCGDGDGAGAVGCNDSRCNADPFSCSNTAADPFCCGDATCDSGEDGNNCALDCGAASFCGDASCDPGEDSCNCAADCGAAPASEVGSCSDGVDNDCDGDTDCDDLADCGSDAACACGARNSSCTSNSDCCSGRCKGNGTCK